MTLIKNPLIEATNNHDHVVMTIENAKMILGGLLLMRELAVTQTKGPLANEAFATWLDDVKNKRN
jgi:hypothetical protein